VQDSQKARYHVIYFYFILFLEAVELISRPHTCKAGVLPLESFPYTLATV
jgi:hypothetical protein